MGDSIEFSHSFRFRSEYKGLIPRVFFLREVRKVSREIIVRMRDEDK